MIYKKVIIALLLLLVVELGLTMLVKTKKQNRICIKYGMVCVKQENGEYQEKKICRQYAIVEDEK